MNALRTGDERLFVSLKKELNCNSNGEIYLTEEDRTKPSTVVTCEFEHITNTTPDNWRSDAANMSKE